MKNYIQKVAWALVLLLAATLSPFGKGRDSREKTLQEGCL